MERQKSASTNGSDEFYRYSGGIPWGMDLEVRDEAGHVVARYTCRDKLFRTHPKFSTRLVPAADKAAVKAIRWAGKMVFKVDRPGPIRAEFNKRGLTTAGGLEFVDMDVLRILRNSVYAGLDKRGRRRHVGIFTEGEFDAMKHRLRSFRRTGSGPKSPRAKQLLSGLLGCLICDGDFHNSRHGGHAAYVCKHGFGRRRLPGPGAIIECRVLNAFIVSVAERLFADAKLDDLLRKQGSRVAELDQVRLRALLDTVIKKIWFQRIPVPVWGGADESIAKARRRLVFGRIDFQPGVCSESALPFHVLDVYPEMSWRRVVDAVRHLQDEGKKATMSAMAEVCEVDVPNRLATPIARAKAAGYVIKHPNGIGWGYKINPEAPEPALERLPKVHAGKLRPAIIEALAPDNKSPKRGGVRQNGQQPEQPAPALKHLSSSTKTQPGDFLGLAVNETERTITGRDGLKVDLYRSAREWHIFDKYRLANGGPVAPADLRAGWPGSIFGDGSGYRVARKRLAAKLKRLGIEFRDGRLQPAGE